MARYLPGLPPQDVVRDYANYSGSQVIAYFYIPTISGNRRIQVPITAVSYNMQHSKKPVYGYSSVYFDAIAQGQVIVEGQFSINFSYNDPITDALNKSEGREPISQEEKDELWKARMDVDTTDDNVLNSYMKLNNPEDVKRVKDTYFEAKNVSTDNDSYEREQYARADERYRFENNARATSYISSLKNISKYTYGFNVDLVYGDFLEEDLEEEYNLFRLITLKGVQVIGQGQTMQVTGQPIQEVYSFIAKELI